jgi:amino acid adenylation domain-containing protein
MTVTTFSDPSLGHPTNDSISLLDHWRRVVGEAPEQPALTSAGVSLSFAEADRISDLAALELVGVLDDSDAPVGILAAHTAEAFLAILTVLKVGRIHVFLDPAVPADRLRHYVEASGLSVCLTVAETAPIAEELTASIGTRILFDDWIARAAASSLSPEDLDAQVDQHLAAGRERRDRDGVCIVFTSGSTGHPKGVVQTHDSLMHQVDFNRVHTGLRPGDRVLVTFPLGFVAGVAQSFGTLLNGVGVWYFDSRSGGLPALADWIEGNRLTVYASTPYLAKSLAESLPAGRRFDDIRIVMTGGEAITGTGIATVRRMLPPTAVYLNGSGSSESGATATAWVLRGDEPVPAGVIPAGGAIVDSEIHIVGDDGGPVEPGELGEIVFVSRGLSGGYWRDPERTAERFTTLDDGRIRYATGDLGRLDADGSLLMAGRSDNAVKVRGYLVEPSEVESALTDLEGISDAVVVPVRDAEKPTVLVAYVVPTAGLRAPSIPAIRRELRRSLPEYMVPAEIVHLTALPRTERGKVDRLALPAVPERKVSEGVLDPRTDVMAQLWSGVLEISGIGADDDFMALGGDSLAIEELLAQVKEHYGVTLSSRDLMVAPTLAEFTKRVAGDDRALPGNPDVVPLNTGNGGRPLFCIAGAGALALTYLPLSRQFADRDVYAFQAHGLEEFAIPDRTVRAHAERVIRTMRIVQPHGPYVLVGHSFGGYVALEIAHLLRSAGEEIELLVILDTFPPDAQAGDASGEVERVLRAAPVSRLTSPIRRLLPNGLPARSELGRHVRSHLAGLLAVEGPKRFASHTDHAVLTLRRFVPHPFDGRVVYVKAETNPSGMSFWKGLLTGELIVETLRTDHTSLLREPEVQTLAATIRRHLVPQA